MSAASDSMRNMARNIIPPTAFDVRKIREDFPVLWQRVRDKPLVYLDNAATSQKPRQVIDAMSEFYAGYNANIHRGVHTLSEQATAAFEGARMKVQRFINAAYAREIIFVRGATEAINLVAHSFGRARLKAGDEIILTQMEHHSNIVPWQLLRDQIGVVLRVAPMNETGELLLDEYARLFTPRTRLVTIVHMSNALGTINPAQEIVEIAHGHGVPVLLDGAQATPHMKVDVQALDCDFYTFSGHKLYGPTGIGVLYGKTALLNEMPPYQGGGDMINMVTFEKTQYNSLPYKFEAGTPDIAGAIGLGAAIDYLDAIGLDAVAAHEHELLAHATEAAAEIHGLRLIGTARNKGGILSFALEGVHPHDIGTFLDHEGVAIRSGHHCAMPVMDYFHVPATARASFALYNTKEEIDVLMAAIRKVKEAFGV